MQPNPASTAQIYKEELSITELLAHTWEHYLKNFQLIFVITLVIYVPINIILALVPITTWDEFRFFMRFANLLEAIIGIVATLAIAYAVKKSIDGKEVDAGKALSKGFSKWWTALWTAVLGGIFLIGLYLLLIVPGFIYSIYWYFVVFAVILDNKSGKKALDHSKKIVKGRWWTVFAYILLLGVIGFFAGITLAIPFFFLPEHILVDIIFSTLVDVIAAYFLVALTVFYINFDATKKEETKPLKQA